VKISRFVCACLLLAGTCLAQQTDKPRNIIILIGDGMGPTQVSASVLSFENNPFKRFTSTGFSVTCSADALITDSAAGGTVIATGQRTNNGYIGIDPDKKPLQNILELAEKHDKSTGVVVTSSVTHATPASFVAHAENRKYEEEIASDFLSLPLEVAIGGGWGHFLPKNKGGRQANGINLIDTIKALGYEYYDDEDDFLKASPKGSFYALFEEDALPKACDRDYTLGELVAPALKKLNENPNGFVLMIEGSQIDWGGHAKNGDYVISEMKDFNTALNTVLDFAQKDGSTLVLVIADHETGGAAITGGQRGDIDLSFVSGSHTAAMVPVFTFGPGEEQFRIIQENFEVGRKLQKLVDSTITFK
jgi:alkaline phosphatase